MINAGIHRVTRVDFGEAEIKGGTAACPHTYAVRTITVTTEDGQEVRIDLFADELESLARGEASRQRLQAAAE